MTYAAVPQFLRRKDSGPPAAPTAPAVTLSHEQYMELLNRLVRMETRLVKLMAHSGMDTPKDRPHPGREAA